MWCAGFRIDHSLRWDKRKKKQRCIHTFLSFHNGIVMCLVSTVPLINTHSFWWVYWLSPPLQHIMLQKYSLYSCGGFIPKAPVYLIVSFRHCQITYQRHIAHFLPLATWVPPIPHTFTRTYKPFKTLSNMMNKKCHLIVIVLISLITCVVEHFYGRFGNSDIFFDLPVNCTIRL